MLNLKKRRSFSYQVFTKKSQIAITSYFDNVVLISRETAWLNCSQIDSIKKLMKRINKRSTKLWFPKLRILAITKKPSEVRLGKGKGSFKAWLLSTRNGNILVESSNQSSSSFRNVRYKLSLKTKATNVWL